MAMRSPSTASIRRRARGVVPEAWISRRRPASMAPALRSTSAGWITWARAGEGRIQSIVAGANRGEERAQAIERLARARGRKHAGRQVGGAGRHGDRGRPRLAREVRQGARLRESEGQAAARAHDLAGHDVGPEEPRREQHDLLRLENLGQAPRHVVMSGRGKRNDDHLGTGDGVRQLRRDALERPRSHGGPPRPW